MNENRDLYEILGLNVAASPEQIKTAFRNLAQKHHPDLCKDNSAENIELFVSIKEAYETLSDPEKRNEYNKSRGFDHYEEVKIAGAGYANNFDFQPTEDSIKVDLSSSERLSAAQVYNSISKEENANGFRVAQKASIELEKIKSETEEDETEQLEEVAAWGEEPTVDRNLNNKKTSIFNRVGSILSKASSAQTKRLNLKSTLKSRMSEEPDRAEFVKTKKAQNPFIQNKAQEFDTTSQYSAPRGERIFEFRISKLEALVGAHRKLALPGRDGEPIMRDVSIPAGVSSGQVMEVSWGWERAKVRVLINFEALWDVRGLDLFLRLPVTIDEVVENIELSIPCFAGQCRVKLLNSYEPIVLPEKGLYNKSKPGNLVVTPCVAPPAVENPMLTSAITALESNYQRDVRENLIDLIQNPSWFWSDETIDYLQVPVTFGEAYHGASLKISIEEESVDVLLPKYTNPETVIEIDLGQRTLFVLPVVILPEKLDSNALAATKAISQFYNAPVRKNLPKKFSA